jgi:antirestriction protein
MNHEQQPPQEPKEPNAGSGSQWDPNEQVGDIYEVDIGPQGVEHIEKLRDRPQIWVGSLSDYNNGILHGNWIDAARDPADVHTDIQTMLAASPRAARSGEIAEEWGIFDFEGFGPASVHQHDSIELVCRLARGIGEHGLAFAAWASATEGDDDALDRFEDAYLGHHDSLESYVQQLVDDLGYEQLLDEALPETLRPYVQFDVAALARDMHLGGDVHTVQADDGGVWVFDGR